MLCKTINTYNRHKSEVTKQRAAYNTLQDQLQPHECVITMDFKQNIQLIIFENFY